MINSDLIVVVIRRGCWKSHDDLKAEIERKRVIKREFLPMLRWISILGGPAAHDGTP